MEADMAKKSGLSDPRSSVIDALMALAAEQDWASITLTDIAERAGLSLADLRDLFPSKGAILGGFIRRMDRITLESAPSDLVGEPARDRVLDLMLRRFDALLPYRAALASIHRGFQGDILGLAALNQQALNSWRYLLESAGISTEGAVGSLKLQGAILVFARAFKTFLSEDDPSLPQTMAVLDTELKRGEWVLARADGLARFVAPLRGFCQAMRETRAQARAKPRDADPEILHT
jgi:AcrR family transcriptional regulator